MENSKGDTGPNQKTNVINNNSIPCKFRVDRSSIHNEPYQEKRPKCANGGTEYTTTITAPPIVAWTKLQPKPVYVCSTKIYYPMEPRHQLERKIAFESADDFMERNPVY